MAEETKDTARSLVLCVLIVLLTVVATFWYILSRYDTPVILGAGDNWQFFGPMVHLTDVSVHNGEWPQWNPLAMNGQPLAADPQSWLHYPPSILRSLLNVNPTPYSAHLSMAVMIVAHLLLAGVTTYLFARSHCLSRPASYIAAFGYIFSANFVFRSFGHPHFMFILSWLPLMLLTVRALVKAPGRNAKLQYALVAGLLCGLAITGGFPHISFLTCLAVSLYAVLLLLLGDPSPEPGGGKSWGRRIILRLRENIIPLLVVLAVGSLASTVVLLPLAEYAAQSSRADAALYVASRDASSPVNLFRALVTFPGSESTEGIKGAGVAVLILALLAWNHPRRAEVLLFALLTLVFLDIAMGPVLVFGRLIAWRMPFVASAGRATLVMCFFYAMVAAFGADAVTRHAGRLPRRVFNTILLLAAGAVVFPVLYRVTGEYTFLRLPRAAFVVAPAALLLCALAAIWIRRPALWLPVLTVLVFAELLVWNHSYLPHINGSPEQLWSGDIADLKRPRSFSTDNYRRSGPHQQWEKYDLIPAMGGVTPLYLGAVRQVLCHPSVEDTYRRHVDGIEPSGSQERGNLFLKRPFWLCRQFVRGALPNKDQKYPSATTIFLPESGSVPQLVPEVKRDELPASGLSPQVELVAEIDFDKVPGQGSVGNSKELAMTLSNVTLPGRHSAMEVAYASTCSFWLYTEFRDMDTGEHSYGRGLHCPATGEESGVAPVVLPDFNRLSVDLKVIPDDAANGVVVLKNLRFLADLMDEGGLVQITRRTANTVELRAGPLLGPRMLLFTDPMYPGWRAWLNGEQVPVFLANDVFKAIELPPGTHSVRFAFSSWRVWAGIAISVSTVLVTLAFLARLCWSGRAERTPS